MLQVVLLMVGVLFVPSLAFAGGPLAATTNGQPVGWDTVQPVPYSTDQGSLGFLSNVDAVATVDSLFRAWQDVPTGTIAFTRVGSTAVDVDETNFGPYLGPYGGFTTPRGENAIVFDADGAIFDTLFGVGTGILGFAGPVFFSDDTTAVPVGGLVPPGFRIIEGIAFLNGKWIDGVTDYSSGNFELPLQTFEAVFVHEFGHFAGLDHTQIHGMRPPPDADAAYITFPIETMYSFLMTDDQRTLERDDVVALSALYPTAGFLTSTGRIRGRVLAAHGELLSGINVIAWNVADQSDAVSYVSGATLSPAGAFSLAGLTPGASYRVEVQEIDAFASGGSSVGPFSIPVIMPGPPEAYNGPAESADPAVDDPAVATPILAAAGVTQSDVDIVLNIQRFAISNVPLEADSDLRDVVIDDFDGDSIPDFVAPQFGFVPGNLTRFYRGLGGGVFAPPVDVDAFPGNAQVVRGQFNAEVDTFPDLAVASRSLLAVRVYFGDGTGGFVAPVTILDLPNDFNKQLVGFAVGDANGDAFSDIVTAVLDFVAGDANLYASLGSGGGSFSTVTTYLPPGSAVPKVQFKLAQLTGSTAADIVGLNADIPAELALLTGDGSGGFTPTVLPLSPIIFRLGDRLDVGDFNEDGSLDLVLSDLQPTGGAPNFTRSYIDVLLNNGAGDFVLSDRYAVPETGQSGLIVADLNADTHIDLASVGATFGTGSPGAKLTVAFGDGAGGFDNVTTIWGLAEFPGGVAAADLDGNNRPDLLVHGGGRAWGLSSVLHYSVLLQNLCGDGVVDAAEQCDDGNLTHGDGCDGNCTPTACGNGVLSAGEECDDGNTGGGDGCSPTCQVGATCGDGILGVGEQCEDGNIEAGDCCSPTCTIDPAGTACTDDSNLCTTDVCDAASVCIHAPGPPQEGCRGPTLTQSGLLLLKDKDGSARDQLTWRWKNGTLTPKTDFGSPTTTTDYSLCVYDGSSALISSATITGGSLCGTPAEPCWSETSTGFEYDDRSASANGIRRIELTEGLQNGAARIEIKAKGQYLHMPELPQLAQPIRIQLTHSGGVCWEATYSAPALRHTETMFKDRAD